MRRFSLLNTALWAIAIVALPAFFAACSNSTSKTKDEPMQAGTFRSRALLPERQRRTFDSLFLEAQYKKHRGNITEAEENLERALKINPNASEALYELAKILLRSQENDSYVLDPMDFDTVYSEEELDTLNVAGVVNYPDTLEPVKDRVEEDSLRRVRGEQLLVKAYQLEPKNTFIRQSLADHWVANEKYARAARIYEEIVAETPSTDNLAILLQLHSRANQNAEALAVLDRLEDKHGADHQSAVQRFNLLLASGDKAAAFSAMRQYSEEHPDDIMARLILSELYVIHGYNGLGYALFDDVEAAHPNNPLVAISKLQLLNSPEKAEEFEKQLLVVMRHPEVEPRRKFHMLYQLSLEEFQGNRPQGSMYPFFCAALETPQPTSELAEMAVFYVENTEMPKDSLEFPLRALLRDEPGHEKARVQLLMLTLQKGETEPILELCMEGIEQNPDQLLFYYFGGVAQTSLRDDAAALATLLRGTEHITEESDAELAGDIYAALGDIYHKTDQKQKAFAAYDRSLEYFPDNASCLNNFAYFLALERQQLQKAVKMSQRAVELKPQDATYLDTHAWVLFTLGRFSEAKRTIDSAIELIEAEGASAEHDGYYDHAGDIYFRCRQTKAALAHWQKALQLTQDADLAAKLRKKKRTKRL